MKHKIILLSLVILYIISVTVPWNLSVLYYVKHISLFLFLADISYLVIKKVYLHFNEKASTDKQIKINGITRVTVQGLIVLALLFGQLRYIERNDTLSVYKCNYYDHYGQKIYESQVFYSCPTVELIEKDQARLVVEFSEVTKPYFFENYFYHRKIEPNSVYDLNLSMEMHTTIDLTYNSFGYITKSVSTHSLKVNNHDMNTSVLSTKQVVLENTYDDGVYTSLKTTKFVFDKDYQFTGDVHHLSVVESVGEHEYTYTTIDELEDYEQIDLYHVVSDEFGNPLEGETPELLFSSKVENSDSSVTIDARLDSHNAELIISKDKVVTSMSIIAHEKILTWESKGQLPYLKSKEEYNSESLDIDDRTFPADIQNGGSKVMIFQNYGLNLTKYPAVIETTDYGFIEKDYTRKSLGFFSTNEENYNLYLTYSLMNTNLTHNHYEIYDPNEYFDFQDYNMLYQVIPCFYSYQWNN